MEDHCCDSSLSHPAVEIARTWIGTPYVHQASCNQVGTDCLGLLRGIWRTLIGPEPRRIGAYSPGWAEANPNEDLLTGLDRHLLRIKPAEALAGDVLVFRMLQRGPAKHLAILSCDSSSGASIIHAYTGLAVCETSFTSAWQRRLAAAYRLPMAL